MIKTRGNVSNNYNNPILHEYSNVFNTPAFLSTTMSSNTGTTGTTAGEEGGEEGGIRAATSSTEAGTISRGATARADGEEGVGDAEGRVIAVVAVGEAMEVAGTRAGGSRRACEGMRAGGRMNPGYGAAWGDGPPHQSKRVRRWEEKACPEGWETNERLRILVTRVIESDRIESNRNLYASSL